MMKRILFSIFLMVLAGHTQAQIVDLDRSRLSQAAYYNYSEDGDITIKVHVWGAVRFSGLYEVPRGTSLSELVSLAGGPQFGERNRRATRSVDLKLHRNNGATRMVVFQTQMENQIVVEDENPVLSDGDVLTFEATIRQGFQWRDIFPIVSMVGTVVLILDRVNS